jgi:hypothetical protein
VASEKGEPWFTFAGFLVESRQECAEIRLRASAAAAPPFGAANRTYYNGQ